MTISGNIINIMFLNERQLPTLTDVNVVKFQNQNKQSHGRLELLIKTNIVR